MRRPLGHLMRATVAVGTAVAVLTATVSVATRLPGLAGLGRLGGSALDYARGPAGEYFPLTDTFVRDALGTLAAPRPVETVPIDFGGAPSAPGDEPSPRSNSSDADVPPPDEVAADLGNDNFASAYPIRGLPFTASSTAPSTREPDEPDPCGPPGGTRWFRFTPRTDVGLLATTRGTELGAAISVYTGTSMSNLTLIECAGGPNGEGQVTFPAEGGTTYWFQAKKTVGDGALVFSLHAQGTTTLASVSNDGRPAGADQNQPQMSAEGRFVVFSSNADLVPGTQNGCVSPPHQNPGYVLTNPGPCLNVYVRDLARGTTALASTRDGEVGGDDGSSRPAISGNGRFVTFHSWASNLVTGDTNNTGDYFLRDLLTGQTTRVSVTSSGQQTMDDDVQRSTAVSDDGRFVVFSSKAPELASGLPGPFCEGIRCLGMFVRDVQMGRTHLVSVDADGDAYPEPFVAGLTPDGSRISFTARSNSGGYDDVIVSDWQRPGQVTVASVPADPEEYSDGRSVCFSASCLSADGRYVAFVSYATNLVAGDTNAAVDVFVRDLVLRRTTRVSVSSSGGQSTPSEETISNFTLAGTNASSGGPGADISPDGRYVAFSSDAPDLVPGDSNGTYDVFLHDRVRGTTTRVSVHTDGNQSNGVSFRAVVSRSGRSIAFTGRGFEGDGTGTFAVYVRQQPAL